MSTITENDKATHAMTKLFRE